MEWTHQEDSIHFMGRLPSNTLACRLGLDQGRKCYEILWCRCLRRNYPPCPIYECNTCPYSNFNPKVAGERLDHIRRNFMLEGQDDKKKTHLMKWRRLNLKDWVLVARNIKMASLTKWWWRFKEEIQALWRKIIDINLGWISGIGFLSLLLHTMCQFMGLYH